MTRKLWSATDLAEITGGTLEAHNDADVTGFSIDSRTLAPGEAYVAIKGDVHDGHKFVGAALGSGASLAIVSKVDDDMRAPATLRYEYANAKKPVEILKSHPSLGAGFMRESLRGAPPAPGSVGLHNLGYVQEIFIDRLWCFLVCISLIQIHRMIQELVFSQFNRSMSQSHGAPDTIFLA